MRRTEALEQLDVVVGEKIRARREHLGMSQTALAHTLGVSFPMIGKYERGKTTVNSTRLQAIATALDTTAASFFENMPPHSTPTTSLLKEEDAELVKLITSPEVEALNRAFGKIADPRIRKRIVSMVRAIAQMDE